MKKLMYKGFRALYYTKLVNSFCSDFKARVEAFSSIPALAEQLRYPVIHTRRFLPFRAPLNGSEESVLMDLERYIDNVINTQVHDNNSISFNLYTNNSFNFYTNNS